MCAAEKQKYQEELAAISEAEGQRQKEMESLEEELTHLAFLAVQMEECEKEFREQQAHYQASLKELRAQNQASTAKLGHLQGDVQHAINQQAAKVQGGIKEMSSQISAADLRILELERALAKRDANLASVKSELQLSQERVKLLESAISSQ
jgi:chromosome segregation ATPase